VTTYPRKIEVRSKVWSHSHGWTGACVALRDNLHVEGGVPCFMSVDDHVFLTPEPPPDRWVGFTHCGPYQPSMYCLEKFLSEQWHRDRTLSKTCVGLFCLADWAGEVIRSWVDCPVSVVPHPTAVPTEVFTPERYDANPDKKLVVVGHVNRDFQALHAIPVRSPRPALLDCGMGPRYWSHPGRFEKSSPVEILPWLPPEKYDQLLAENIVFLPLRDAVACNAIVECMARATPVLVTRVGGVREYLGDNYPGYYTTLREAASLAEDWMWVRDAHEYLKGLDRNRLSLDRFASAVANSDVYRELRI
jgi:glycosyltransferase involved in cell wall biosynthesis